MTTQRGYITATQLETLAGLGLDDAAANAAIERAEAIIDGYIGHWAAAVHGLEGVSQAASATTLTLSQTDINGLTGRNYLVGCVIEFLSGDAIGRRSVITSQSEAGDIVFDSVTDTPQAGDIYRVYQAGKVPRRGENDLRDIDNGGQTVYVRVIPAELREAVAAQVQYMQEIGDDAFNGNSLMIDSERIGSYSYNRSEDGKGGKAYVAPRVKQILAGTGIINRGGRF